MCCSATGGGPGELKIDWFGSFSVQGPTPLLHHSMPMSSPEQSYLEPTQESGRDFLMRGIEGEIVMLNLLRFREIADYSGTPHLAPDSPISGAEAYDRYIELTLPHLTESGGGLEFYGVGGGFLIGPPEEHWDVVMLVRHRSVEVFMAFASNEAYLDGVGHRTAAIADSRLLPIVPRR